MEQKHGYTEKIGQMLSGNVETLRSLQVDSYVLSKISLLVESVCLSLQTGGKLIVCGNGGFASLSNHIVAELMGKLNSKRDPYAAMSLCSDSALLTCVANDFGFEKIFSRQLRGIAKSEDIFVAFTTSGKSKNILEAVSVSMGIGLKTFVFTGSPANKSLIELGANLINIPSDNTAIIQDVVMTIFHHVCNIVESEMKQSRDDEIWNDVIQEARLGGCNTLLLDRDGVVNNLIPNGYATTIADISLNESFISRCKEICSKFENIFLVSNQACIGKGLVTSDTVNDINNFIVDSIRKEGGRIDKVYICPDAYLESHLRKPNIGMAELIKEDFPDVDFSTSLMVGDSYSDKLFAQRIGAHYINIQNA